MKPFAIAVVAVAMFWPGHHAGAQSAPEDMVRIKGADFTMGRPDGALDETPAHKVRVASFFLDAREVTNAEFAEFLNARGNRADAKRRRYDIDDNDARIDRVANEYRPRAGFERQPVTEPTWFGARDYCAWKGKRLPTEAEWELAARGTQNRRFPWGNSYPDKMQVRFDRGWMDFVAVGSAKGDVTPDGVFDMGGNVHEWTSSLYRPYPYRADDGREDPNSDHMRVTRGGAADRGEDALSATWRGSDVSRNPRSGHHNIGFRCAKSLTGT